MKSSAMAPEACFTVLIDSREQAPLTFPASPRSASRSALPTNSCICDGVDLRDVVAIERKSVSDLLGCVGSQRQRFERELCRLAQLRFRALVIEATLNEVVAGTAGRRLTSRQVVGSVLAWTFKYGVEPIFAGDRTNAAVVVATLLHHAARYELAARVGCGIAGPAAEVS